MNPYLLSVLAGLQSAPARILLGSLLVAFVVDRTASWVVLPLARRTAGKLDDAFAEHLPRPIAATVVAAGVWYAAAAANLSDTARWLVHGVAFSGASLWWSITGLRIGSVVVEHVTRRDPRILVRQRMRPLFEILSRVIVVAAGVYFVFLSWGIDVTAWAASAGIVGVAVGFAAQETLANLIAGIVILVDAPYKVGDWLLLDGDTRVRVVDIGIRSTRVMTPEDVEIVVPNSMMANSRIVNPSGGPRRHQRMSIRLEVIYGSDLYKVRRTLLDVADHEAEIIRNAHTERPQVVLRRFADSGVAMELHVWIPDPAVYEAVSDRLHQAVYDRFTAEGIQFAFPTRTVVFASSDERPGRELDPPLVDAVRARRDVDDGVEGDG